MPPHDSAAVDNALVALLSNDATLKGLMPDGVYFDIAKQGATKFVLLSLVDEHDVAEFGRRALEDYVYMVKAVEPNKSGVNADAAAARIDALLEDGTLTITGYALLSLYRVGRIRDTEPDPIDQSIRWQHRGGRYRVLVATNSGGTS